MNTETGQIYRGGEVIEAWDRGEPLVKLTEEQAAELESLSKEARRAVWRARWFGGTAK